MKHSVAEDKPCLRVFRVELDQSEVQRARDEAYAAIAGRVELPGFRKGKVPPAVLQQRYGKAIGEETVERAVGRAAGAILAETGLRPIVNPSVSAIQQAEGGLSFNLTVELAPLVALGEYEGLHLVKEAVIVRPEDVDSVIDGLRRRMATHEPVQEHAQWGQTAVIDYDGTLDGQPFEGGQGRDVLVFIGKGEAMRDIEESLVGRRAGERYEVPVTYQEDHANKALAGRTALLTVTVKEVRRAKLPDLDEVAKGAGEYDGTEAMRRGVTDKLRAQREAQAGVRLRSLVVDRLLRFAPTEVSPTLVEEEMQYMAVRGGEELGRQGLKNLEQLRLDAKKFRELFRPSAIRAVREAFVLEAVAEKQGIEVGDDELKQEIQKEREGMPEVSDQVIEALRRDGRWERLKRRLRHDRTLDWVIQRAEVTERRLSL